MTPDVWIVGLGITSVDQLTREAERAIRGSREVLFLDTGVGTREALEQLCPRVTDLVGPSYREGVDRRDAYRRMAVAVVEAALDHPPVTLAVHGHPLVFSYPPFLVRDMAAELGLSVRVLPGISALATLACDLGFDPCRHGLVMVEATDMLLRQRPLRPDMATLVWQVGSVESRLHTRRVSRPERFHRLRDHLLRFFPADHRGQAAYSSPHPLARPVVIDLALGELPDHAERLHPGFTLYLPPAVERPIHDAGLAARVDDPAHLRRVTR